MTLKTDAYQIGNSLTATQNFSLEVPAVPDGTVKLVRGNANAGTQDLITVSAAGEVSMPTFVPSSAFGFRNKIIGGDFTTNPWQRGTTFTNTTSSYIYCADRWRFYAQVGTGSATVSRQAFTAGQTGVPGEPSHFLRWNQTVAATGSVVLSQPIEDVRTFAGQTCTLSFYAKAGAGRDITVRWQQNFGSGGSGSVNGTAQICSLTTSWQKFTKTFTVDSISGKTIGADHFLDLQIVDSNSSTFTVDIALVQLEAGSVATPFETRPYGTELSLCQRFFLRLGGLTSALPLYQSYATTGSNAYSSGNFPSSLRSNTVAVVKNGTWLVSNCGQPTFVAYSQGYRVSFTITTTGAGVVSADSTDDYVDFSVEF